jgi:hypothetical protein
MEDTGICRGHLDNFTAIWYILKHFGIFCGHVVYFPRFGMYILHTTKNLATLLEAKKLFIDSLYA